PLPDIESDLTIEGPANGGIAISGQHAVELISIDALGTVNSSVALRNLTFTQAESEFGGAINNNGILKVDDCTFSDNSGNGGAIVSIGTLTVTNSTFAGNTALAGAALGATPGPAGKTVSVVNSTFYGNMAVHAGGGDRQQHIPEQHRDQRRLDFRQFHRPEAERGHPGRRFRGEQLLR